jgi:tetratricopeptide (TPR) repeat protein
MIRQRGKRVARRHYNRQILKVSAGILLLIVSLVGLEYGSLLRAMDQAAEDYGRSDVEAALKRYDKIEGQLRSFGVIRLIPAGDRRILFLDEARSLYALGRYNDALERLERENQFSGTISDSRFSLLRAEITFRKATKDKESAQADPQVLLDGIGAAEDDLRESLRQEPNNWDAKYNFEYINHIRNELERHQKEGMKVLPQIPDKKNQKRTLSPKQKT